jgi:hypothetical protein
MYKVALNRCRRAARSLVVWGSVVAGATALVPASTTPSQAEETAKQAALAQQQRMRVLEARLQYLEEKLAKIERETVDAAIKRGGAESKSKGKQQKGAASNAPAAKKPGDQPAASGTSETPGTPSTAKTPAEVAAESTKEKESVAQETFIFRDQSPTLKKGQIEASMDFGYVHSSGFLQTDRIATQGVSLRYGIIDGLEVAASLPHYDSVRTTSLTPGTVYEGKADGIGSANLGLSYSLLSQTPDWPGVAVSLTGIYPGNISPYGVYSPGFTLGQNPTDILRSVQGSGHWGVGANVVAYKIVDPLLLFVGGGPTYYFPRSFGVYSIEPAMRYSANVGFSFALTEKTTLAFQAIGFYQPNMKIDGVVTPQSFQEQYVGRGALTVRVWDNTWVEPSLAIGLTKESPAMNAGVTFRKRW